MAVLYESAVHRPMGDLMLGVEFGDELALEASFRVIALDRSLKADPIAGVMDTVLAHRTLGIVFDPFQTTGARLSAAIRERESILGRLRELPSRTVTIPVWYGDPWSHECALEHGVPDNLSYLAEINGTTTDKIIDRHSSVAHWVSAVGFQPGTYQAFPFRGEMKITAPKYERPRKRSPARTICLAGQITSFYPFESPGGYQLLGITPLELFDPGQRNEAFADGPVLPIVGERHRYVPIDAERYREIRSEVEANRWEYEISEGSVSLDGVSGERP